jgi:hypothetical protein
LKAFAYPKAKHKRGTDPGPFKDYGTYKPYLRDEFQGACVYCRLRDSSLDKAQFAVEHHMPQKPFTALVTEWTNLYYACRACNGAKSNFYPTTKHKAHEYVPTPCNDVMFDHLRYQGPLVVPHSKTGKFVETQLDLNEPRCVEYRKYFQRVLDEALVAVAESEKLVADVDKKLVQASGALLAKLNAGHKRATAKLQDDRQHLAFIVGPY